jgi:hypothetical protein
VNDTLRIACELPDANIRSILIALEVDREAGLTKSDQVQGLLEVGCQISDPFRRASCQACFLALVEQVYRE